MAGKVIALVAGVGVEEAWGWTLKFDSAQLLPGLA